MKSPEYASLLTLDQGKRPDWRNEKNYEGHEGWNYRLWAWQFLKRNPYYQKLSHSPGPQSRVHAQDFGRVNLKHYKARYTEGDDADICWLTEGVSKIEVRSSPETVAHYLERGEVLMVFDLKRTVTGGRAAISAMIANAKRALYGELDKFESSLSKQGKPLPRVLKPRRDKLLPRLRMLDAMWKQATDDELSRAFYPGHYAFGKEPDAYEKARIIRKIRDDQRAAIQMMESGYLELVPLDYLEEEPLQAKFSEGF